MDSVLLNFEELEKKYEKLLEEEPKSPSFVFLAEILIKQNKREKALVVLNKGIRHNPDNITGRFLLGRLFFESWLIDQAKKQFEYILSLSPDNLAATNFLLEIYKSEDRLEDAEAICRKALVYFPGNSELVETIAELQRIKEKQGHAANKMDEIDSNYKSGSEDEHADDTIVSETIADLYFKQGLYRESIRIYEKLESSLSDHRISEKKEKAVMYLYNKRQV